MDASLEGFLTRLNATASTGAAWNETLSFLQSLGFDLVMYGYACPHRFDKDRRVVTLSNYDDGYHRRYSEERYYLHDPVVHHCIGNITPKLIGVNALCSWPGNGGGLSPIQRRITHEAAECGMKVGVVFPLRSPGPSRLAGMSLANAMKLDEFKRLLDRTRTTAQLATVYAHMWIQTLLSGKDEKAVSLTSRERECLLWSSRGLSSKEIALRLGVSFRTVDFHLANAMDKLGTCTRSHAVARAIALELVNP